MRNTLPTSGAHRNESGIVNLDDATGPGTHWVTRKGTIVSCILTISVIFDRPRNWCDIFGNDAMTIEYKRTSYQTYDQSFCGQMCLRFLETVDAREFKKLDEML